MTSIYVASVATSWDVDGMSDYSTPLLDFAGSFVTCASADPDRALALAIRAMCAHLAEVINDAEGDQVDPITLAANAKIERVSDEHEYLVFVNPDLEAALEAAIVLHALDLL